ncbi:methylated-DNA--[protein]-cysteine S-methyltransferase [Mesobacillus subterraneus]|uniref:methylated-DNA--[protein]-cysteine S-methyltransferase n=1 Tax=Mesobacillus subterraneus TaxID=285983 RepID=A0A427TR18_9BACI|nr:methylated-DNA--[protein]-cysteine S-methyltransferase [Mesobacillus subterraneus]RSD26782.1 methylated-DNA--[protein]-cysteine S-methyltransferase [Mesobacillus subterraneus]
MERKVYYDKLQYNEGNILIAATANGLCYVGSPDEGFEELEKRFPGARFQENTAVLKPFMDEMAEYLEGSRTTFSMSFDVKGTPFQEAVWAALKEIPYGKTCTYTEVAEKVGKPSAVRAVGTAIGANPVLITVPCHRVIGKNGKITGYRGGIAMKQQLLELETR